MSVSVTSTAPIPDGVVVAMLGMSNQPNLDRGKRGAPRKSPRDPNTSRRLSAIVNRNGVVYCAVGGVGDTESSLELNWVGSYVLVK